MPSDLRLLQQKETEILFDFVKVCEENSLRYYLAYGTLLGAIRHDGFIPWDDDIDVEMPREDFDLFCREYYKKLPERLIFKSFENDEDYSLYAPKIEDSSVKVKDSFGNECNVWIDIFPVDGFPSKEDLRTKIFKLSLRMQRTLLHVSKMRKGSNMQSPLNSKFHNFLVGIIETINPGRFMDCRKRLFKLDKLMRRYDISEDGMSMVFMGEKFKDVFPFSYYGNERKLPFEGKMLSVPEKTEEVLTAIYGDYMQLPPEEQRNLHNVISIRVCNND